MIVLVSSVGDWWIDEAIARKVAEAVQKGKAFIHVEGSMIATNSIRGLLQPEKYKAQAVNYKRNWICKRGSSHTYNDNCWCKDPVTADLTKPALAEKNDLTPEQQAAKDLRALASREWISKHKPNWKKIADKEGREKFIKDFEKNYGKTIDSTVK